MRYALNVAPVNDSPFARADLFRVKAGSTLKVVQTQLEAGLEGVSKDLAKQIALGVKGISAVDNRIVVKAAETGNTSQVTVQNNKGEADATPTAEKTVTAMAATLSSGCRAERAVLSMSV